MKVVKRVPVTPSNFAMWRAAIALAHSDHRLSNSEISLIQEYSANFDFSEAQQAQLEKDLHGGIPLESIFLEITEKTDRAHLINFARVLFHIDGEFSAVEQKIWQAINDKHMQTVDMKQALKDAAEATAGFEQQERVQRAQENKEGSWLEKAFAYLSGVDEES
jgi:hypothetical protein